MNEQAVTDGDGLIWNAFHLANLKIVFGSLDGISLKSVSISVPATEMPIAMARGSWPNLECISLILAGVTATTLTTNEI